jgi:hypothetical protein
MKIKGLEFNYNLGLFCYKYNQMNKTIAFCRNFTYDYIYYRLQFMVIYRYIKNMNIYYIHNNRKLFIYLTKIVRQSIEIW